MTAKRQMIIRGRRIVAAETVELTLDPADGAPAPAWEPGAHLDVLLPSGTTRQYSISGGSDGKSLSIAVLREENGRGGSVELHETLLPGTVVAISGPRNHFKLAEAARYVFVAGGIGITPILAMVREATDRQVPWILVYGGRTLSSMAYLPEIEGLLAQAQSNGSQARIVPQDQAGLIDIAEVFDLAGDVTPVYACGPEPMLAALEAHATSLSRGSQLHLERFGAASTPNDAFDDDALETFEVEIASTGVVLEVGPDDRIIDVIRTEVPSIPFSCEEGYCGSCETGVLSGTPCHRDQILSQEERDANDVMMICVGRSASPRLTLEL